MLLKGYIGLKEVVTVVIVGISEDIRFIDYRFSVIIGYLTWFDTIFLLKHFFDVFHLSLCCFLINGIFNFRAEQISKKKSIIKQKNSQNNKSKKINRMAVKKVGSE